MPTITPDQIKADLEAAAVALEFVHRIPPAVFTFLESFANSNWTGDQLDALSTFLSHRWTVLELHDALEGAKTNLPKIAQFICSDTSLAFAQKLRDTEQRRILIGLLARFLGSSDEP